MAREFTEYKKQVDDLYDKYRYIAGTYVKLVDKYGGDCIREILDTTSDLYTIILGELSLMFSLPPDEGDRKRLLNYAKSKTEELEKDLQTLCKGGPK